MKYFNLFSNILVTRGATRVLISDLQRNTSKLFPIEMAEIIDELKKKAIEEILNIYDPESQEIIHDYISLLLKNEYGFISEGSWDNHFPQLSSNFRDPSEISTLFMEIKSLSILDSIQDSVERSGIKFLVIYCRQELGINDFQEINFKFKDSVLSGIQIFSPFHKAVDLKFFETLQQESTRIYSLVFYNCVKVPFKTKDIFRFTVNFSRENLKISSCGKVDLKYFNTNISKVSEAIHHNSCLHKKIGIDLHGNIRNCPLMPESFGNINDTSLEEALSKPGFRKYWNITKDQINICKDCEFRYICTDCRAYTERNHKDSEGLDISKPLKCGYDPYTGKWEAWSKNPLKKEVISFYGQS